MAINKKTILTDSGVDTLLYEIFSTIADHYIRLCAIDATLDVTSTNVVQNKTITEAFETKADIIYGFELDLDESDPASKIRYIGTNALYTPAHMDYTNDVFDYGDWGDAWFIKGCKPCVLNFDGTVECYLDPDDYSKDMDGNDAPWVGVIDADDYNTGDEIDGVPIRESYLTYEEDFAEAFSSLEYNIMVEIPTVWIKVDTSNDRKPKFWFAPKQIDETYHAYAHTNADGDVVPYIYLAAYEGWKEDWDYDSIDPLRSLSGILPVFSSEEGMGYSLLGLVADFDFDFPAYLFDCARETNEYVNGGEMLWDSSSLSDRMLITLLLLLIGKNTNCQAVFGNGNSSYGSDPNNLDNLDYYGWIYDSDGFQDVERRGFYRTGSMNDKGLFWGSNDDVSGVKVFGIEHFWGNIPKLVKGLFIGFFTSSSFGYSYKLSAAYLDTPGSWSSTPGVLKMNKSGVMGYPSGAVVGDFGILPMSVDNDTGQSFTTGSSSTYFCDKVVLNNPVNMTGDGDICFGYGPSTSYGNGNGANGPFAISHYEYIMEGGACIVCRPKASTQ